ncbi:MAG: bifunctional 4-hydroxy-2-oxoglutarate aldolase/2-dehydro-3-deoxy-phosphogluconate aldolase [Candidatus Binatia bacterium]
MVWSKQDALSRICEVGLIPILRTASTEEARCAAEAVLATGIGIVEITTGVPDALALLKWIVERYGSTVLPGVGTVLDPDTCRAAIAAGAEFIVAPNFDPDVVAVAGRAEKLCIPGALTPTEVHAAWRGGADMVKVFPCGALGGPEYIRALRGPLPQVPLVPTGGVSLANIAAFIDAGVAALGVGGDLLGGRALAQGGADLIRANTTALWKAVRVARDAPA